MNHDEMEEFEKDVKENERRTSKHDRAPYFKLANGDNKVVFLTNPVGFSELFGVGIAYKDCGYGAYASRKYKCYVLDMKDSKIKIMNLSYTVAKKLLALKDALRTQFKTFPMPYVVNLKSDKAGTKEVNTETLAEEDWDDPEVMKELEQFDPIRSVLDNLESYQKKMVETDPAMKRRVVEFLEKKEEEKKSSEKYREMDIQIGVPKEDDEEVGEIPF